jgi:hypothetical protein
MSYFPSAIDLSPLGVGFRLAGKALEMFSGPEERKSYKQQTVYLRCGYREI